MHRMDVPRFAYAVITRWTFALFPPVDCCRKCCYEHSCTSFCLNTCFQFFRAYIPRCRITDSSDNSMFNLLRSHRTFPQQRVWVLGTPCPPQHLLFFNFFSIFFFFITVILVGMNWYLIMGLICISVMIDDTEHLFTWCLAIILF